MDSRIISKIIIHCSDSPDDRDIGLDDIDKWHMDRGFSGVMSGDKRVYCGYHYVIKRDGTLERGRPEHAIGAHALGNNKESIGICLVGRDKFTDSQMATALNICASIMRRYVLSELDVYGHYEVQTGKTCPNMDMNDFRVLLTGNASLEGM